MARSEQYEVWTQQSDRWQLIGSFVDFEIAAALARTRGSGVRIVRAIFEDEKRVGEEILLDIGTTRRAG